MAASKGTAAERQADAESQLAEQIGELAFYPDKFVRFIFRWGEKGSRLEREPGPDKWQEDVLRDLGKALRAGQAPKAAVATAIQLAVASGHGIGKTALVAWIIHWFASCFPFNQTVVTANTKAQLLTKTWRELAKWSRLAINGHWFEWTATQYKHRGFPDTWFASAIPWSAHASEAFAGTHEENVLVVFDEASLIDDKIWEVTEGAMTTATCVWVAFGNPTRNTGRFAQCFGRLKHRWITRQIDSRTAKMANKAQIEKWIQDYGEDSDFVRVRVRGVFPRAGSLQFMSGEEVRLAMERLAVPNPDHARIMGVDVARHGDDQSCTILRQGLHSTPARRYRIADLMMLAARVVEDIDEWEPDAVCIDVTGMGWGVYDRVRQLRKDVPCYPIQVGEVALEPEKYYNRRAELWWHAREWVRAGGALHDDVEMEADLTGIEYGYDARERVQMEKKEDMKERGLASPDGADALCCTFAVKPTVKRKKSPTWRDRLKKLNKTTDYSPQSA